MAAKRKVFTKPRWMIVTGRGTLEQFAAGEVGALVQQHVPYILQTLVGGADRERLSGHNVLAIGTAESNELVAAAVRDGKVTVPRRPQSYAIKVLPSPFADGRQLLVLAGRDEAGVLYAARDFEHYCYDPWVTQLAPRMLPLPHAAGGPPAEQPFHGPVPPWFDRASSPAVANRGIWTWGHVIYDYRRFIDHMSRWKMNTLIVWNDFAPANAAEVVAYAHGRGVKLVWGFTWCWGEKVDPNDPAQLARWRRRVLDTYERQYAGLGGDGIYFQTFTETTDKTIGRKTIAELAAAWVNDIAGALLQRHPELWIQFGVHAMSIGENARQLAAVDPRVNMTWEDLGGFPYWYDVGDVNDLAATAEATHRLAGLRGRGEDVGFVLKGMSSLSWPTFEHQQGPFVMGRADRDFIARRAAESEPRWKRIELGWRRNLHAVCRTVAAAVAARPNRLTITGLVEDMLWEDRMWLPPCLLAEVLWDPREKPAEIVAKVAATRDAHCLA